MMEFSGAHYYMPPEIIKRDVYDHHSDIWSLGIITYLLLSGNYPFQATSTKDLHEQILEGKLAFFEP